MERLKIVEVRECRDEEREEISDYSDSSDYADSSAFAARGGVAEGIFGCDSAGGYAVELVAYHLFAHEAHAVGVHFAVKMVKLVLHHASG